jgi:putative transposase
MADRMESQIAVAAKPRAASFTPTEAVNFDQESCSGRSSPPHARSMGQVGSAGDNAAMESFFSLLQNDVLNRQV